MNDRNDSGFALAAVVLALFALTGIAAAGFLRANTDYRINQNHRASLHAFYVADAARSNFMGRGRVRLDTVTYSYTEGDADVWLSPLLAVDDSSTLYQLNSSGAHSAPEGGESLRRLGSIILHKVAGFSVNAAFTAPNGLAKNGTAGTLNGTDNSPIGSCSVAQSEDVAGLAVPPGGNLTVTGGGGKGGGGGNDFLGNPPVDSASTSTQMLADTGIDWQGLLDGSFAQADYTYTSDGWPNFSTDVASDEWPLILVDTNSHQLQDWMSGRGTIVLQGDGIATGDFNWDGLILVGGKFTSNGIQDVDGAVITGLNELLGASNIPPSNLGNGTWSYQYDACNVLNALKGIGWPVEEPGTWFEVM